MAKTYTKLYICNRCGHQFDIPNVDTDDEGDEQYESCPNCHSENFEPTDKIVNLVNKISHKETIKD